MADFAFSDPYHPTLDESHAALGVANLYRKRYRIVKEVATRAIQRAERAEARVRELEAEFGDGVLLASAAAREAREHQENA